MVSYFLKLLSRAPENVRDAPHLWIMSWNCQYSGLPLVSITSKVSSLRTTVKRALVPAVPMHADRTFCMVQSMQSSPLICVMRSPIWRVPSRAALPIGVMSLIAGPARGPVSFSKKIPIPQCEGSSYSILRGDADPPSFLKILARLPPADQLLNATPFRMSTPYPLGVVGPGEVATTLPPDGLLANGYILLQAVELSA